MYNKGDEACWKGRIDDTKLRAHFRNFQVVSIIDAYKDKMEEHDVGIIGYAVDQGVYLNQGRRGAVDGPNAIRKKFANLPLKHDISIADFGNVTTDEDTVEHVQLEYADLMAQTNNAAKFHFLIGGGHDISYAHYKGLKRIYPDAKVGVINIDAHFDLRDAKHATSGTGFKQILDEDKDAGYLVLGIQETGNTQHLFNIANQYGVHYVLAEEVDDVTTNEVIKTFIDQYDVIMLTLCLDVIDSSYAPGVSAPCSFGLTPQQVERLIRNVLSFNKTKHFSIAEMNPEYDIDDRTAKLVAHIMFHTVHRNPNIE
ncbi:formimidoylglutamase [Macrococcoides caseolyticum]|uniref:formimidoylglutamase n=1 Tax=Macrococcoides caseolyticum TaxID=69966 RepID=UPI001F3B49D5|nr:formimidoylglutamase [Macrococcus caseolyticus]MCE4956412.1 formimidoylglutamase [Macrococcus caseolyticus]